MALQIPFLSTGPKVTVENNVLVARTSTIFSIISLGLCLKSLRADPQRRVVTFRRVFFWVFAKTREIPFDQVKEVHYRYENMHPFASFTAADSIDCYTVILEFHNRDEVTLFRWMGEGEFSNESLWPDWMYWEEILLDVEGTQKKESLAFFEALRGMIIPKGLVMGQRSPYAM
ncbi:hypothetical protein KQI84_03225 [bacterium]|nr:hypothetical protein [bacterium]